MHGAAGKPIPAGLFVQDQFLVRAVGNRITGFQASGDVVEVAGQFRHFDFELDGFLPPLFVNLLP